MRELFTALDLPSPGTFGERSPHQVSGGQLAARHDAMPCPAGPTFWFLDEPTTALDVTVQIEVLALLKRLIARFNRTAGAYITTTSPWWRRWADRLMVLRHGKLVETGETGRPHPRQPDANTRAGWWPSAKGGWRARARIIKPASRF